MVMADSSGRLSKLNDAFKKDGFQVKRTLLKFDRLGIEAEHQTAYNYDTGQKKKVYYLEGTSYQMGYLMGLLAETDIEKMTEIYIENVLFSFLDSKLLERINFLKETFPRVVSFLAMPDFLSMPQEIQDEMQGIVDGCREQNPRTKVTLERLISLNLGFDVLLSMIYTGNFLILNIPGIKPSDLDIPMMCNAFSVFGRAAGWGHYFGRDFMFPTSDVFQDTATMLICNPVSVKEENVYPFVSVTAPGITGSISAMNSRGVAIGMDMSPSADCDPHHVGLNSLLLARRCIQYGESAEKIVQIMRETQRGVSWNYVVSDGNKDKACVVEAGQTANHPDPLKYPPKSLLPVLPDYQFINRFWTIPFQNGLMVRWSDYRYPAEYLTFNRMLWQSYNKLTDSHTQLYADALSTAGFINRTWNERNCPSQYYFAPQREARSDLIITTNHYIIPEMRFTAMYPWTANVIGNKVNGIQWRYDALNNLILTILNEKGSINYQDAKTTIDFLAPYGKYPAYYAKNPRSRDGREIRIEGCTSLFDLKNKTIESHYGYYCDEWVKITLPYYVF